MLARAATTMTKDPIIISKFQVDETILAGLIARHERCQRRHLHSYGQREYSRWVCQYALASAVRT